jgi:hypothetical protein
MLLIRHVTVFIALIVQHLFAFQPESFPITRNTASFHRHPSSTSCSMSTLIVAEDPLVALGAALAIATNDILPYYDDDGVLDSINKIPEDPPSVTRFSSSSSLIQQQQQPSPPFDIAHVVVQSKEDAQNLVQSNLQSPKCLGIQVAVDSGNQMVAPETAQSVGALLQEILYAYEDTRIAMTLDLPLHLALLQANVLPKTTHHNSFHVLCGPSSSSSGSSNSSSSSSTTESIVVEYCYDWNNPFGGTDPLACPSKEVCLNTKRDYKERVSTQVQAGAYTALRGSDASIVDSVGIAASVAAILAEQSCLTEYSPDAIHDIVNHYLSRTKASEDSGILRKKYIEFGYK